MKRWELVYIRADKQGSLAAKSRCRWGLFPGQDTNAPHACLTLLPMVKCTRYGFHSIQTAWVPNVYLSSRHISFTGGREQELVTGLHFLSGRNLLPFLPSLMWLLEAPELFLVVTACPEFLLLLFYLFHELCCFLKDLLKTFNIEEYKDYLQPGGLLVCPRWRMSTFTNAPMRKGYLMTSDFGDVTSAPDSIKPPSRLPLAGDYLLAHVWLPSPSWSPLGKLKHLIIVMTFTDADNRFPRFSPNVSTLAPSSKISVI